MSDDSIIRHKKNYSSIKLQEAYVAICQNGKTSPHCKALILSILEDLTNVKIDNGEEPIIYMTYPLWVQSLSGLYGRNVIIGCIFELIEDGLIIRYQSSALGQGGFGYSLNASEINTRIKALPLKTSNPKAYCEPVPVEQWESTGPQSSKVRAHRKRALAAGTPATLTTAQWEETLEYYDRKCAICRTLPYQDLEHFIPLVLGGGTTADNCIPACSLCNRIKGGKHPSDLLLDPKLSQAMHDIQRYLATRKEKV